jgi:hypothetical protein
MSTHVADLTTTDGHPMFDEQTRDYLRRAGEASLEATGPWRTGTCPECGTAPAGEGLIPDDDGSTAHVVIGGAVVLGCEGYWVISPAALGMPLGAWDDWRQAGDTEITLTAGKFSVDYLTPFWDGFDEPGKRWNGWRMPFFTEQVMLLIKAHMDADPATGDDAIVIEHHPEKHAADRFTVLEQGEHRSIVFAVHVNGTWLWQLGDGWCWVAEDLRLTPPVPAPEPAWMTAEETEAVQVAVQRDLRAGSITWDEIRDRTLADLVASNQDALIEDMFEDHADDRPHRREMAALIGVYDRLLGTSRATEIATLDLGPADVGNDPDRPYRGEMAALVGLHEIDHAQCPPGSHTFDAGSDTYEGRVDEHGNQLCNDCGTPMFYCRRDEGYHHVQQPGSDPAEPCFLIQEPAWPVPAPQPGEHAYELEATAGWVCLRHEETCPPLDTAVLTHATAIPPQGR